MSIDRQIYCFTKLSIQSEIVKEYVGCLQFSDTKAGGKKRKDPAYSRSFYDPECKKGQKDTYIPTGSFTTYDPQNPQIHDC